MLVSFLNRDERKEVKGAPSRKGSRSQRDEEELQNKALREDISSASTVVE